MPRPTRRSLLKSLIGSAALVAFSGLYAFGVEPAFRLRVQRWALTPPGWTPGLKLSLAVVADLHVGEPYMALDRVREIVAATNRLEPDLILLLGDYVAGHRFQTRLLGIEEVAPVLAGLQAPLGIKAILGNHDWWDDPQAQARGRGPTLSGLALAQARIPVLENEAVRLEKAGRPFWVAGLGDQLAIRRGRRYVGVHDLAGTLAQVTDDAPLILLAHEPDIFPEVPERVSLTLSGHTHGGQVRLFGYSPLVPSRYGNRYAYGHVVEGGRHLVVSGGLGTSILPVRLGMPPEITLIELG